MWIHLWEDHKNKISSLFRIILNRWYGFYPWLTWRWTKYTRSFLTFQSFSLHCQTLSISGFLWSPLSSVSLSFHIFCRNDSHLSKNIFATLMMLTDWTYCSIPLISHEYFFSESDALYCADRIAKLIHSDHRGVHSVYFPSSKTNTPYFNSLVLLLGFSINLRFHWSPDSNWVKWVNIFVLISYVIKCMSEFCLLGANILVGINMENEFQKFFHLFLIFRI